MQLVCKLTGERLSVGDHVQTFRNEPVTIVQAVPPRHAGSEGCVVISFSCNGIRQRLYPSVIGAHFVSDEETERLAILLTEQTEQHTTAVPLTEPQIAMLLRSLPDSEARCTSEAEWEQVTALKRALENAVRYG